MTPMDDTRPADLGFKVSGFFATALLHGLVVAALLLGPRGCDGWSSARQPALEEMPTIEAALAFKKTGKRKTRQPQKQRSVAVKPPEELASRNPTPAAATPPAPAEKPEPRPEKFDPMAVLERNRRVAQDDEVSTEPLPEDEGADDGSEWGTEADAKGDPYVGELKGRVHASWEMPTLERGAGSTLGCVRLNEAGEIVHRELDKRSGNANLDRSVDEALRKTAGMDKPVPPHLRKLLIEKGICIQFRL